MNKRIATLLLAGFLAFSSFAADWNYVGKNNDESFLVAYERSKIKKAPLGGILVWTAEIYKEAISRPYVDYGPYITYDLVLKIYTIDCESGRSKPEQAIMYLNGEVEKNFDLVRSWTFSPPGSLFAKVIDSACARKRSKHIFKKDDLADLTMWGRNLLLK